VSSEPKLFQGIRMKNPQKQAEKRKEILGEKKRKQE
jgi:hypothetical protein